MKTLLLFFSLSVVFNTTKAQVVFCPPGAEWHYNFVQFFEYDLFNEQIKYTGDVVIGNETLKKLVHSRFFIADNSEINTPVTYIKQSGDTIFMKNIRTQNNWQILYNFGALPGQFWTNTFDDGTPTPVHYMVMVDSISHVTLNGILLKRMYVTYDNDLDGWGQGDTSQIIERIGNNKFLFNYECHPRSTDDDHLWEFLCYQDNSFGLKQFSSKPCDFADALGIEEENFPKNLNVYPNPTSGKLNLKFSALQIISVRIENALGQLVYEQKELNSDKELDLGFLSSGIYYLTIQNKSEQKTLKLVKE